MMRYEGSSADLDRTLMALADPVRRRILQRLADSEARVTDVASGFSISLNSVSKHIRLLERARLVERHVSGREHLLRFQPEPLSKVEQWIATQQAFWASRLQALDDLLTAEDAANNLLTAEDAANKTPPARTKEKRT
ncbi:MAG: winged helix-turn-helix transcriptional regulator [Burkholderiaceae bacterium]|nr:winged helix-turn-helix transcriptional regulator [Burkholderiaceae bacterium]